MKRNPAFRTTNESHPARRDKAGEWSEKHMDILIRTEGLELNDELREAVNRKIGRVRQYAPRALRARVQLYKLRANPSPRQYCAKVRYEVPGNDLFAGHKAHDPLVAINLVAEKIEGRLRRRKTARLAGRVRDVRARAHRPPAGAGGVIQAGARMTIDSLFKRNQAEQRDG
jgi:putative sigma-54 modulation protein